MSRRVHYVPIAGRPCGHAETLSATPNTAAPIAIPGAKDTNDRPTMFNISFVDGSDQSVRGRWAVAPADDTVSGVIADDDVELGHMPVDIEKDPGIPSWATHIIVASDTASALCYVTWLYETQ